MDSPDNSEDFQGRLLHQGENLIFIFFQLSNKKGEKDKKNILKHTIVNNVQIIAVL